jgi:hypothetical protein
MAGVLGLFFYFRQFGKKEGKPLTRTTDVGANFKTSPFASRHRRDVPDERDLRFASTGSDFNPPEAGKSSKYSLYGCLSRWF